MKHLVVVATTDVNRINFVVIHRQKDVLRGCLKYKELRPDGPSMVDVSVYVDGVWPNFDNLHGFNEKIFGSEWYSNKQEELQDELIRGVIKHAIPDGKVIGRIINI